MENLNDLIWNPEDENDEGNEPGIDTQDIGGGGDQMVEGCMAAFCAYDTAGTLYVCHQDAPYRTSGYFLVP